MLSKIKALIESCDSLIIAAGAGMSVDSGLPDFRGNEGLWQHYPPLKGLNIDFKRIADPLAFDEDPTLAWGFYGHRLLSYRNTQPHAGFDLLKKLGERFKYGSFVFTSNVDGQFQKAGFNRQRIYECHGSIHSLQCTRPDGCGSDIWSAIDFNPVVDDWTPDCMAEEIKQRDECDFCLYVITPKMTGVYSIAEVVDDSNKRPKKTIFCILPIDDGLSFNDGQLRSLNQVGKMVKSNGGNWLGDLLTVAEFLNCRGLKC